MPLHDDALWQTHAVDDRGIQCGWISMGSIMDPACGAWTALLYYDYWRTTGDITFLRDRAYPYIYGIMRGYEEMLRDFNIPLAISAEYACSNPDMTTVAGRNPSYQLAAIRRLAMILIEISAVLKREERPVWRQILDRVPPYSVVGGYDYYGGRTEKRIGIWEGQDLANCHRHHSHLGSIWPFDSLPEHPDAEMEEIVANSIDHWIAMGFGQWSEWCIPWANIIYTRVGLHEAPMQLFNIWREIFVNEGLCTVYLPRMLSLIAHRRHDIAKPKAHDLSEAEHLRGAAFRSPFSKGRWSLQGWQGSLRGRDSPSGGIGLRDRTGTMQVTFNESELPKDKQVRNDVRLSSRNDVGQSLITVMLNLFQHLFRMT